MCHTSGAFSNAAWLVLHCVTTQNGVTAASGGWYRWSWLALWRPSAAAQQRWPAKLVSPACQTAWHRHLMRADWFHSPLKISTCSVEKNSYWSYEFNHCGNTPITSSEMGVCGGSYTDTNPELSFPVVSGKHPEAESLLEPPLTAVKCWEFFCVFVSWSRHDAKMLSCIVGFTTVKTQRRTVTCTIHKVLGSATSTIP